MTTETPAEYARRMGEHEADIPAVLRRIAAGEIVLEPRPMNPPSPNEGD
jgi:hypothetical protein